MTGKSGSKKHDKRKRAPKTTELTKRTVPVLSAGKHRPKSSDSASDATTTAQFHREPYRRAVPPDATPVTDPHGLDLYERLFYDEDPKRSHQALTDCVFYWSEAFTYDEAGEWFALGAGYDDLRLCVKLTRFGIPPSLAGRGFYARGHQTGMTVFGAVASGALAEDKVRIWAERVHEAQHVRRWA
jgi:hypothetical protein